MLRVHKEGFKIITGILIVLLLLNIFLFTYKVLAFPILILVLILSGLFLIFILRFFRIPSRKFIPDENLIFSPADGTVVNIKEVSEPEYFRDNRILVSVFMSVWNVHINWYPLTGLVKYFRYHPGKYLVAWHPKSSELNERTSLVLQDNKEREILVRQIAGIVARRIVYYPGEGMNVQAGEEMGFIKFGSRLDVYLPLSAKILVKNKDKVKGKSTPLAAW